MIRRIITYIFLFSLCTGLSAQVCNTIYFMDRVPQSNQLNPAFQPKCDFYLGLTNIQYNFRNTFSINDMLKYDSQIDSLITPLHPHSSVDQFLQKLNYKNSLFNSLQVDPFSLGLRIKDMYFTLGISAKMDVSMKYPTDLVKMALTGVFDSTSFYNFENLGVDATAYGELALGVSRNYNDVITFGVRAKLLTGLLNMKTNNNKFTLYSTMDNHLPTVNVNSDLSILATTAFFQIDTNAKGQITDYKVRSSVEKYYKPFKSMGLGLDLGVSYTGIEQFNLSASLLDLGYIKWNNDEYNFRIVGDTAFQGIQNINFFGNDSDLMNKFVDSLKNVFRYGQYSTSYTTWLPAKLYLGAEYMPSPFFSLGFLSLTQYYRQQFYQQFMLSANLRLFRMFMLSTSYSIIDNGFSSLGVGLSFRLSPPLLYFIPLNIYFISDNIPLYWSSKNLPLPYKLNSFNFRFGMNIVFGCGQKRKMRDKPLIVE